MLLDARAVPAGAVLETDLCIIGAGVAGIAIATEMTGRGTRVMLLEAGARSPNEATQALYEGAVSGHSYYPLRNCRVRQLGGTSSVWGGWSRPLDAVDFGKRAWMPFSGWPFLKEHLTPVYERAQRVCGLGPYEYDAADWRDADAPTPLVQSPSFSETMLQIRATRFGEEFHQRLSASDTVQLLLRANVLTIEMDAINRTAQRVQVATLDGNRFFVSAKRFVLAAGGLENPRLLLASRVASERGVGNDNDLVGRFFFDHLHAPVARLRVHDRSSHAHHVSREVRGTLVRAAICLSPDVSIREKLYGFGVTFHNARDPHDIFSLAQISESYDALRYVLKTLARGERPAKLLQHAASVATGLDDIATMAWRKLATPTASELVAGCRAEQAPNPDSRVMLDDRLDVFGAPRARLEWRISETDLDQLERAQAMFAGALETGGIEFALTPREGEGGWAEKVGGGAHHMGTTRMHRDPTLGVVDQDCRVHGTSNVFVAGSSVFPTGGWAPPTLTIVALALRLADHLRSS